MIPSGYMLLHRVTLCCTVTPCYTLLHTLLISISGAAVDDETDLASGQPTASQEPAVAGRGHGGGLQQMTTGVQALLAVDRLAAATGSGEYAAGELGYAAGDVVRSTRKGATREGRVIKMNKAGSKWQVTKRDRS